MSNFDAINADIRRRAGRGVRPSAPELDPEQAARIRDFLTAAGEEIPAYLQPKPAPDWGGGFRGQPLRREGPRANDWIREEVARKQGIRDA
jgi:hypothetical protein